MWARNLFSRTLTRHKICLAAYSPYYPHSSAVFHAARMASTLPRLPIFEAIKKHDAHSTAVVHSLSGRTFTYGELVNDVAAAKDKLQRNTNGQSAEGQRISFLVENGYDYVGAHSNCPSETTIGRAAIDLFIVTLLAILAARNKTAIRLPADPAVFREWLLGGG